MKTLTLLLGFIALNIQFVNGQNSSDVLRCVVSDHYFKPNPNGMTRINKPCSICYNDEYFSFYIPELGTRSFTIAQPASRSVSDGILREDFDNEEDETMPRDFISVDIEYGHPTKTFVISFTMSGDAYLIQSNKFLGDAEMNTNEYATKIKTALSKQRTDSTQKSSGVVKTVRKNIVAHKLYISPDKYDSINANGDTIKYRYLQSSDYTGYIKYMQDYFNKSFTDTNAIRLLHYPYQNNGIELRPVLNNDGTIKGIIDADANYCPYSLCNVERMNKAFYDRILAEIILIFKNCPYKWTLQNENGNVVYIGGNLHINFPRY